MGKEKIKTRIPQQKRGIETRNRIIEAALVMFCQNGYIRTNAKEITAEAGVSVGSFYAYFKDKKALFMEVAAVHVKAAIFLHLDGVKELPTETATRREMVRNMIQIIADTHNQAPELHREIEAMKYSDPDILAFAAELKTHLNNRFVSFLEQFGDQLRVTDLEAAIKVIASAVLETIQAARLFNSQIGETRLIDALTDMIHRYLFK